MKSLVDQTTNRLLEGTKNEDVPGLLFGTSFSAQVLFYGRRMLETSTLALASSLRRSVMTATTRLSKNTRWLRFAAKLFQHYIKRDIGVYDKPTYHAYQRERPAPERGCGW
jgi:hypothetical protein